MSNEAARQRISRQNGKLKRLDCLVLHDNDKFYYLEEQRQSKIFYEKLIYALKTKKSVHYYSLVALASWGGRVKIEQFKIISGTPHNRKKQKTFDSLLAELFDANLIKRRMKDGAEFVELTSKVKTSFKIPKTRCSTFEALNEIISNLLEVWLKKTGIGSFNKVERCHDFNSYTWSLTAPSYIFPLYKKNQNESCAYICIDILPQDGITKDELMYFVKKFEASKVQYKSGKFLAILIGNRFDSDAFGYGRDKGFIITTPEILFGKEVAELILAIKDILESKLAVLEKQPNKLVELFSKISRLEGSSLNLRGALFELIVGFIANTQTGGAVSIGKIVKVGNRKTDIDVFIKFSNNKLRFIEAKGYNSSQIIQLSDIEKWEKNIKLTREWINRKDDEKSKSQIFEYWTASSFSQEALQYLKKMKEGAKKYKIEFLDLKGIKKVLDEYNLTSLKTVVNEHYGDKY